MLETNGNQRFIFSSPRLRDNVGASSLLTKLEQWIAHELLATGAAAAWCTARGLPRDDRAPPADVADGEGFLTGLRGVLPQSLCEENPVTALRTPFEIRRQDASW